MAIKSYYRLLSALYMSTFLIRTSFGIMIVTFGFYLKVSDFTYGVIVAGSPMLELCTVLFIGTAIDRYGRKGFLVLGLCLGAVFLYLLCLTENIYAIFMINACHGMASGIILVSSLALLADYAPIRKRGREMGAFDAVNIFGWFTGFILGFILKEVFIDLRINFAIAGVLATYGAFYTYLNVTEPHKNEYITDTFTLSHIKSVLVQRSVMLLVLPWLIVFLLIGAIMAFLPRASLHIAISGYEMALYLGLGGLGLISTQIFYGKLSDKHGRLPIMFIGTIGFVGLMCTIGLGYLLADGNVGESVLRFWPLLGVFGFMALAFGPSSLASLADVAQKKKKGVTMGVYSVIISTGMIIGPPIVGYLNDNFGGFSVLLFMTTCAVLMLLLVILRYIDVKLQAK